MRVIGAVATVLVVALIGTGAALALVGGDGERTPAAVSVAGVDVSGMTGPQTQAAIRARADELLRRPIVIVRHGDRPLEFQLTPAALGATPQIVRATRAARAERGPFGRLLERVGLAPQREVALDFTLDEERIDRAVARANRGLPNPPVGATLRVKGDDVVVVPGHAGVGIDEGELRAQVAKLPERIDLEVARRDAPVSTQAAEAARARALEIAGAPVTVTFQDRGVPVQPAVLRTALRFRTRPPQIAVQVDPDTIYTDISPAFVAREQPPRDAHFAVNGDRVRLVPSADGRRLDMAAIAAGIASPNPERTVRARFEVSHPQVLTKDLAGLGISEQVGEFSTPFNCCEPRVQNITQAAKTIDGMIIAPGARFSLNDALGPRTTERGYVEAPQISGGKLEDGVGGGVSQVATTLFNAAFFAGLKIEQHQPHSFYISRYPPGREATISMVGPDLVFVNDWDASLLISAKVGDNDITIRLFSTSFGRRVETETGEPTDYVEPEVVEVSDPTLAPGEREVDQSSGGAGFTITYTRTVFQGDRERSHETFRWTYSPENAYVRVGPQVAAPPSDAPAPSDGPGSDGGSDGGSTPAPAPAPSAPEPSAPAPSAPAPSGGGAAPPAPVDLP